MLQTIYIFQCEKVWTMLVFTAQSRVNKSSQNQLMRERVYKTLETRAGPLNRFDGELNRGDSEVNRRCADGALQRLL